MSYVEVRSGGARKVGTGPVIQPHVIWSRAKI